MGSAAAGPSRRGDVAGIPKLCAGAVFDRNRLRKSPPRAHLRNTFHEFLFGEYQQKGDEMVLQGTIDSEVLPKSSPS